MKYLYLIVNLGAVIMPLIFSFHRRIGFYKQFGAAILSILIVALPFVAWDMYFTRLGVWGFNPRYIMGVYLGNLPLEEVMFFFTIPYSCLFTYFVLKERLIRNYRFAGERAIGLVSGIALISAAIIFRHLRYTEWTLLFAGIAMVVAVILLRRFFTAFLISYLVLLIPFFITNGILTGTGIAEEIVWYNRGENLGIRVLTIPIEDFFYGMLIILLNIMTFEQLRAYFSIRHYEATT